MSDHSEELERLRAEVKRHLSRNYWFILAAFVCAVPILFAGAIFWGLASWWVFLIFVSASFIVGQTTWALCTPDRPRCPVCDTDWTHELFLKWKACKTCGLELPPPVVEPVTASASDDVTIRAALWLWIGYFRIGSRRERWLRWRRGLIEMDRAVVQQTAELRTMPFDDLLTLVDDRKGEPATFLGRHGTVMRFAELQPDDSLVVIVAGFAPMLWWPLGTWTVINGFNLRRGKEAEPLAYEVLDRYW